MKLKQILEKARDDKKYLKILTTQGIKKEFADRLDYLKALRWVNKGIFEIIGENIVLDMPKQFTDDELKELRDNLTKNIISNIDNKTKRDAYIDEFRVLLSVNELLYSTCEDIIIKTKLPIYKVRLILSNLKKKKIIKKNSVYWHLRS